MIMIHGGLSAKSGRTEELGYGSLTYNQPTIFFRTPSRRNLEIGYMAGRTDGKDDDGNPVDYSQYNQIVFGASQDIVLGWKDLYFTVGLGAYIKSKATNRIGSKFTFGQRAGIGTNFSGKNIEIFGRHFSNGGLTDDNSGQNFVGLSLGFDF